MSSHGAWRARALGTTLCGVGALACSAPPRVVAPPERPAVITGRAPDFDGDGYADLAVGAPGDQAEEIGRVFVYLGDAAGFASAPDATLAGPDVVGASFGRQLAIGDFDGDGLADLAVAAADEDDAGKVYVFRGGARGLVTTAARVLVGEAAGASFGAALAAAGDVNGDGFADLIVGAPGLAGGRAYLYLGSAGGLPARASATYFGDATQALRFGAAVAGVGDVDGDRFGDVVVGAPLAAQLAGTASVFAGAAERLSPVPVLTLAGRIGRVDELATSLAGVGDLNGDGFADLVLAGPLAERGRGLLRVHRGARGGLSVEAAALIENPDGNEGEGAQLGGALAGAGDVDGDGLADFVASESRYRSFTGRLHFYRGGRGVQPLKPARSWTGPAGTYARFGAALAGGGDVDGDGFPDVIAAAPGAGQVYVFGGGADGPAETATRVLEAPPGSPGEFGAALAVTPTR